MKRRNIAVASAAAALLTLGMTKGRRRLQLSRAKHPGIVGHAKMGKRVAGMIPFYDYDEDRFFTADEPAPEVAERRRAGFERLSQEFQSRFAKTIGQTKRTREGLSDLHLPYDVVLDAGTADALAGKVVGRDGLLVLTWRLGPRTLRTGFRADDHSAHRRLADAVRTHLPVREEKA